MKNPQVHEAPVSFYESAEKIYPRTAHGRYARLRILAAVALLGIFYILPWLSWDGHPLVLFDLPARRFHLFGLTLVPQDLFLLTGLLIVAAMTLFFFTTLAGRLWCGFACPQTVWTEIFQWIERGVEGNRLQRIKLDRGPWNLRKLRIKATKHTLWVILALWTGLSFVGFFVPVQEIVGKLLVADLSGWPLFWTAFYGFATWGNAGFMREQVCRYMCPYARFQSAMFDRDTLIISYDEARGEPRKQKAKTADAQAGDCIDCTMCVQVCPTGIDIRDGLQYECIACAACVDACNSVMDQVNKPRGLIRYSSTRRDEGGHFHVLRPRLIGYGVVWLAMLIGFATILVNREPLELDVIRDRHAMARTVGQGLVENIYIVKITNKQSESRLIVLRAEKEDGEAVNLSQSQFQVAPLQTYKQVISVAAEPGETATFGLHFFAHWDGDPAREVDAEARFIGRAGNAN